MIAIPTLALSFTAPWGSLVVARAKLVETRSRSHSFRGSFAVHASQHFPRECRELCRHDPFQSALQRAHIWTGPDGTLPLGAIIGVATLTDCWLFPKEAPLFKHPPEHPFYGRPHAEHELDFGDYTPGRCGFALADAVALPKPIPAKGALGFWRLPEAVRAEIASQFGSGA